MRFIAFMRIEVMLPLAVSVMSYHLYSMLNIERFNAGNLILLQTETNTPLYLAFTIIVGIIFTYSFTVLCRMVLLFVTA